MDRARLLRPAIGTALVLLIPLIVTILDLSKAEGDGWHWGPGDLVVMGALLFGAGLTYELVTLNVGKTSRRAAIGCGIAVAVFAVWIELAVDGLSQLSRFLFG